MGLDSVELVMAVEEEFGLKIPNSEAGRMACVDDVLRFVLQTLRQRGEVIEDAIIWTRLTDVIVAQLRVKPEEVTPAARFVEDFRIDQ
jgi:acyl carrier protein